MLDARPNKTPFTSRDVIVLKNQRTRIPWLRVPVVKEGAVYCDGILTLRLKTAVFDSDMFLKSHTVPFIAYWSRDAPPV